MYKRSQAHEYNLEAVRWQVQDQFGLNNEAEIGTD